MLIVKKNVFTNQLDIFANVAEVKQVKNIIFVPASGTVLSFLFSPVPGDWLLTD